VDKSTAAADLAKDRGSPQERRNAPVAMRPNLRAVKDAVRIEEVAQDYGEFRMVGNGRLLGRCLSPAHQDRTPSKSVYTDTQRFRCYGCGASGDVIDLLMLAEGIDDTRDALAMFSSRYGVALPGRPDSWHKKQERQQPVRDHIARAKFEHLRRRLFRRFFEPSLALIEDPGEREEEAGLLWEATEPLARMMLDELHERLKTREEDA
jgi:DNA primase